MVKYLKSDWEHWIYSLITWTVMVFVDASAASRIWSPSPSHVFSYCLTLPVTLAYMVWSPTVQIAGWSNRKGPTIPAHKCFFALYSHPFWCPTLAWQLRARLHGWHAAHCTRERAKRMAATSRLLFATASTDKEWQEVRPAVLCPNPVKSCERKPFWIKHIFTACKT